jgi:RNA polymerase sigma-70 factor (ECF subfamily)
MTGLTAVFAPPTVPLPDTFQDLYEAHSASVYLTALRVTGNAADAEDVLHNVFLRVIEHAYRLDPAISPEHYLRRAATNASIDLIRRRQARRESAAGGEDLSTSPSGVLLQQQVRQALGKLASDDAELFVLFYLEGFSQDELAEQFQIKRGTIASRLHRIRAELKAQL